MKIDRAIREAASASDELATHLLKIGERHKADHDVHHLSRLLAKVSQGHVQSLAAIADRYGTSFSASEPPEKAGPLSAVREKASELMGSRPESGLILLRDLRELYLSAAEASVNWTILGQGAQAVRDQELLDTVDRCHADCLRILRWITTRLKVAAPQVLA